MKKLFILALAIFAFCAASSAVMATSRTHYQLAVKSPQDDVVVEDIKDAPKGRSVNLRVYFPELFVGYVGGVWDIGISRRMSFGPIVRVFVLGHNEGYDFGVNFNYSLSRNLFQSGFVLNPYVEYYRGNFDQPTNEFGFRPKVSTIVVGFNVMYQWMFHSGFNLMLGVGPEYSEERIPVTMLGDSHIHPHYEVTVGYAF